MPDDRHDPIHLQQGPRGAYTYEPLTDPGHQIRIAHIGSGDNGPICLSLNITDFSEDQGPHYQAVSYTWGDVTERAEIHILRDNGAYGILDVTKNCHEALEALRRTGASIDLWIDAVCINQEDDEEKGEQVAMMGEVFSRADKVVAWLGPGTEETKVAIEWLHTMQQKLFGDPKLHYLRLKSDDNGKEGTSLFRYAPINIPQCAALVAFFSRPWFKRVWIWQEIRLGAAKAVIKCGEDECSWHALCTAVRYLVTTKIAEDVPDAIACPLVKIMDTYIIHLCNMSSSHAFAFLTRMRPFECADHKDRVFAILALLRRSDREFLGTPDYSKTWQKIHIEVCRMELENCHRLRFLEHVGGTLAEPSLPSWVPTWTSKTSYNCDSMRGFAGLSAKCMIDRYDDQQLVVRGKCSTSICAAVAVTYKDNQHWLVTFATLLKLVFLQDHTATIAAQYPSHDALAAGLCRVLTTGHWREASDPIDLTYLPFQTCCDAIDVLLTQPDALKIEFPWERLADRSDNGSLLITENGQVGLGPKSCQAGDMVTVFVGCAVPIVLRPAGDGKCYKVLGPAYIDGMMAGEALLGELPAGTNLIWHYPRDAAYYPAFVGTSGRSFQDPRAGELPENWISTGDFRGTMYENLVTGEKRGYDEDPRFDAEVLEARGVELQSFTLI